MSPSTTEWREKFIAKSILVIRDHLMVSTIESVTQILAERHFAKTDKATKPIRYYVISLSGTKDFAFRFVNIGERQRMNARLN